MNNKQHLESDPITCRNCAQPFEISARDRSFYARVEVPQPTWCPLCRHIRRHAHVNDYVYYTRECDSCAKRFVSTFPASSDYRVIFQSCWYSENRDDKAEGRDYDPSRSFFGQFDELQHAAPQMGNIAINCENSDYCESIVNCNSPVETTLDPLQFSQIVCEPCYLMAVYQPTHSTLLNP